ncbi:winged helix-turn-helix transcriptional regulator [Devosia sp.]|uniref:winged helix-turn-helix transcriptional regulator n=1 Tax=Devosia sp. TaxID=1871048 RepID=UPI003F72627A
MQQLREMEEHGLITRTVFAAAPPHVEYSATELGLSLAPLMDTLQRWGIGHAKATGDDARMVYCDGFAAENRAATAA